MSNSSRLMVITNSIMGDTLNVVPGDGLLKVLWPDTCIKFDS